MFVAESMVFSKKTQSAQQQYRYVLVTKLENLSCGAELHTMDQEKCDELSRRCKTRRETRAISNTNLKKKQRQISRE